jgi:hypothetical protein
VPKSRVRVKKTAVASNNTHPAVEEATGKDHSQELVAQIAATLQKPDEPEALTVKRALKLLDATAEALAARAKDRDQQATMPEWLSFIDGSFRPRCRAGCAGVSRAGGEDSCMVPLR